MCYREEKTIGCNIYVNFLSDCALFLQRQQQQQQQQQMIIQGQGQPPGMMGGSQQGMAGQGSGGLSSQMSQPQQHTLLFDDFDLNM